MWLSRSSAGSKRASRSICSTISPAVRLRTTPSSPLAQNTQPIAQPTCELMQIVRRGPSRKQHTFDAMAVVQLEQQLFGAVGGTMMLGDRRGPDRELGGELRRATPSAGRSSRRSSRPAARTASGESARRGRPATRARRARRVAIRSWVQECGSMFNQKSGSIHCPLLGNPFQAVVDSINREAAKFAKRR